QVVEEQCQRMLGPREHTDEAAEHQLESPLRFLWRQFRHWGLFTEDVFELRDQVGDQQPIRLQRGAKLITPAAQLFFFPAQERTDQALESLRQRGVRNVALVLVEFSRGEQAAWRHQWLV